MSSDLKVNTKTKIGNFVDVQRSLQELQKNFNILVEKVASPAEKEIGESEGITGDIQISRNKDDSYTFEVRTEDGWKTPVIGDSLIKFKGKPKTFSKDKKEAIEDIEVNDTTTGDSKANKTIYDEKNDKFVLARPDWDSGWVYFSKAAAQHNDALFGIEHGLNVLPTLYIVYYAPNQPGSGTLGDSVDSSEITWFSPIKNGLGHLYNNGMVSKCTSTHIYLYAANDNSMAAGSWAATNQDQSYDDGSIKVLMWK